MQDSGIMSGLWQAKAIASGPWADRHSENINIGAQTQEYTSRTKEV